MNETSLDFRSGKIKTEDECCDLYDEYCYPCSDSTEESDRKLANDQAGDGVRKVNTPKD